MSAIQTKSKVFHYETSVRWRGEKRGTMGSAGKPEVEVASPPEFRGHPGMWTPEDLLVSAVNSCAMMTFLSAAKREGISLVSYDCNAQGTLEMAEGKFRFTRFVLKPHIVVEKDENRERAALLFKEAEATCLVANSLISEVQGDPEVSAAA